MIEDIKERYREIFGITENDKKLLERLDSFIPEKVFDTHNHIYMLNQMPKGENYFTTYGAVDAERILADQKLIYGERAFGALLVPSPCAAYNTDKAQRNEINSWIAGQLENHPTLFGAAYAVPGDSEDEIEALLISPKIRAFCCYFANSMNTSSPSDSDMDQYIPEAAWKIADKHGMSILVHNGRIIGIADEGNREYIKAMCEKYPNANLILAHGARCFASWTVIENARKLKGIPNLYYDISGICDTGAMAEIIRQAGADHVLWGSDYFVDRIHGKPVDCAEGFRWLYSYELEGVLDFPCPMLVCESLFGFWRAGMILDLGKEEIEKIFYKNGERLFGIKL